MLRLGFVALLSFALFGGAASAADGALDFDQIDRDRQKKVQRLGVTERTEKRIDVALEALEVEDYEEAGRQLRKLSFRRMNPYERALVSRLLAQVAFANGDPQAAIDYFRKALEQEVLSVEDDNSLRFNIAQIQISQSEWTAALATLDAWFRHARTPNPLGHYLRAIISQRLVRTRTGKRVAAVELMLNTPHIKDLILKGNVQDVKEALLDSDERGMQNFDNALLALYKAGTITLEEAMSHADSRANLEAKVNFGG